MNHERVMDGPHVLGVCSHVVHVIDRRRVVKNADLQKEAEMPPSEEGKNHPKIRI